MIDKNYSNFVINYKPFDWEIDLFDFRENIKDKHSFVLNYIRFHKVFHYLNILKKKT